MAERYSLQDPCARFGPLTLLQRRISLEAPPFYPFVGAELTEGEGRLHYGGSSPPPSSLAQLQRSPVCLLLLGHS